MLTLLVEVEHVFFDLEFLTLEKLLAGDTITERCLTAYLASTEIHSLYFLVQTEFDGLKISLLMRPITQWLLGGHSTAAPEVVFGSKDNFFE